MRIQSGSQMLMWQLIQPYNLLMAGVRYESLGLELLHSKASHMPMHSIKEVPPMELADGVISDEQSSNLPEWG